jgi:hypothetical protein
MHAMSHTHAHFKRGNGVNPNSILECKVPVKPEHCTASKMILAAFGALVKAFSRNPRRNIGDDGDEADR